MKKRYIHFVGIKGVGMTPLAIIAQEAGFRVTGSDLNQEFITDQALGKAGIGVLPGFSKEHITDDIGLVITTGAHNGFDNLEVQEAKRLQIPVMTQGEAVGVFMNGTLFNRTTLGIAIAGSHGKTTTTAMIATIFVKLGVDPSYLVGTSSLSPLGLPGHFGKGKYFIAEADEYVTEPKYDSKPKFLWQHPQIGIITNIELDHPDVYPTLADIQHAFVCFANNLTADGILISNGDDLETRRVLTSCKHQQITYGFQENNDFLIRNMSLLNKQTVFSLINKGQALGEFKLSLAGEHNVLNATAAIIVALQAGFKLQAIKNVLGVFTGSKRRAEYLGRLVSGALLFDDYAHHPTEITKTLASFKLSYPKLKIVAIFQPHTYSRTKKLFEQFVDSFQGIDQVIISNIFPSQRETYDASVSSEQLATAINQKFHNAFFLPALADVVQYLDQKALDENYLLIIMGAGDIYKISKNLKLKI